MCNLNLSNHSIIFSFYEIKIEYYNNISLDMDRAQVSLPEQIREHIVDEVAKKMKATNKTVVRYMIYSKLKAIPDFNLSDNGGIEIMVPSWN